MRAGVVALACCCLLALPSKSYDVSNPRISGLKACGLLLIEQGEERNGESISNGELVSFRVENAVRGLDACNQAGKL